MNAALRPAKLRAPVTQGQPRCSLLSQRRNHLSPAFGAAIDQGGKTGSSFNSDAAELDDAQ
uniref:hypothetical protein n=1 Tax=Streptomyces sp. AC550_RSS872 TaxID=2823689 RepID=UPI001C26EF0C